MRKFLCIAALVAAPLAAQVPLPQVNFSIAPYKHNMSLGSQGCVYSGDFCVRAQQWGAVAVNVKSGAPWAVNTWMRSPVTNKSGGYQSAAMTRCDGDFHQSADTVAASAGTPKWVISAASSLGTHYGCTPILNPGKVYVYRLSSSGLYFTGHSYAASLGGGGDVIVGDYAYIQRGDNKYDRIDLNLCSVNDGDACPPTIVSTVPSHEAQATVDGFTYHIASDPAGVQLALVRDQVAPPATATPQPTPTQPGELPACTPTPACTCVPVLTVTAPPVVTTPTPTPPNATPTRRPTASRTRSPIP